MNRAVQLLQEIADKARMARSSTVRPETKEALHTIRNLAISAIHAERQTDNEPKIHNPHRK